VRPKWAHWHETGRERDCKGREVRSAAARKRCSRGRGGFGVHFFNGLLVRT